MQSNRQLGRNLLIAMATNDIRSLKELSDITGVSRPTLSKIKNGRGGNVSLSTLTRIANGLGCDLETLVGKKLVG